MKEMVFGLLLLGGIKLLIPVGAFVLFLLYLG
jgi:hypothetical protein